MAKNRMVRGLIGFVLMMSLLLSACSVAPTEGPSNGETPDVVGGRAHVEGVDVMLLESFPVQVRARIQGNLSDGCTEIKEITVNREEGSEVFEVEILTTRDPELMCTQALVPFEETVDLEVYGLSAGTYTVNVHGETATFELAVDNIPLTE